MGLLTVGMEWFPLLVGVGVFHYGPRLGLQKWSCLYQQLTHDLACIVSIEDVSRRVVGVQPSTTGRSLM